jgi:hypothetical protein
MTLFCLLPQEKKPVSEFYRSKAAIDGFDGRCKICDRLIKQERMRARSAQPSVVVIEKVTTVSRPPFQFAFLFGARPI